MNELTVVPISALEHYAYCPRQCALIHVEGYWEENEHTTRGSFRHARVDAGGQTNRPGVRTVRGLTIWSDRLGLSGRADAIEFSVGAAYPIEYKAGVRHGRTAEIQLCAQALCLEEMLGVRVVEGAVYYTSTRRRDRVAMGEELRSVTIGAIEDVRSLLDAGELPLAVNDVRCNACQLSPVCLPTVTNGPDRVLAYQARVFRPLEAADA